MAHSQSKGYNSLHSRLRIVVGHINARQLTGGLSKFQEFLDLPLGSEFTSGWFISASGFSKPALTSITTEKPDNLQLGISSPADIKWVYSFKASFTQAAMEVEYPIEIEEQKNNNLSS